MYNFPRQHRTPTEHRETNRHSKATVYTRRTCRSPSTPSIPRSWVVSNRRQVPSSRSRDEIGGNAAAAAPVAAVFPAPNRCCLGEEEDDEHDRCNAVFTPARMVPSAFVTIGGSRT